MHTQKMLNIPLQGNAEYHMRPEMEDEHRKKNSLSCYYMNVNFITYQYCPESRTEGFLTRMEAGIKSEDCT